MSSTLDPGFRLHHDAAEAEDRAGRADHALEAALDDRVDVIADLLVDVLHHPAFVAFDQRVGAHEALAQADHADLEALGQLRAVHRAQRDLDAAAADVDDHAVAAAEVDAVDRGEVNQARFFMAGDHTHADAGFVHDGGEEVAAVFGFARRAGRRRDDLVDAVRIRQPLELGERLQARVHRGGRQRLAVETAGAETDHLLLPVDDFEREVRTHPDDDHVDGVGADVDGREPHEDPGSSSKLGVSAAL